jgi:hypothetical protein
MRKFINALFQSISTTSADIVTINISLTYEGERYGHATFLVVFPNLQMYEFFNPHYNISERESSLFQSWIRETLSTENPFLEFQSVNEYVLVQRVSYQKKFDEKCFQDGNCVTLTHLVKYVCARLGLWLPGFIATVLTLLADFGTISPEKAFYGLRGLVYLDFIGLKQFRKRMDRLNVQFSPTVFYPQRIRNFTSPVKKLMLGGKRKKRSKSRRSKHSKR